MKIERLNQRLEGVVQPITKLMSRIASVILFSMMLLTITDVFLRKVFSRSILGTVELTEFLLVIVIFFALAHTEALDGHVKVDLIISRFSGRIQGLVDMITQFVCFLISGLITWSTVVYSEKMRVSGEVSQDLWIPIYPFLYIVAVGCGILALTLLTKFFIALMNVMKS
jgi:TRAP-type C4-dicarboxylate transport system permease small subunit